jgi:nucleoside-diphosphate-sugar epimerase
MNNTYVGNLVEAIFLALESDAATGQVFNVADGRLVTKREFVHTAADLAGYTKPTGTVPLPVARGLTTTLERLWKLLGKQEAPLLSSARIKFLGLNLDFSTAKARRELGYTPPVDFTEGMRRTIDWFREHDRLP